jgi:hypothetical protein
LPPQAANLLHDFETSGIFLPAALRDDVVGLLETIQRQRMDFEGAMDRAGLDAVTLRKSDLHVAAPLWKMFFFV